MSRPFFRANHWQPWLITLLLAVGALVGCNTASNNNDSYAFIVTADMRQYAGPDYESSQYFQGACEAIRSVGKGAFMVSPGDIDPPRNVRYTIDKVLGRDYLWYPVVGNHEAETKADMAWLRDWGQGSIPNLVRRGPPNGEETTYSFNFQNAHFVVINQYYDGSSDVGTNGDVTDLLYQWLKADLEASTKPLTFIFGHEPIVSIPDADNGRHRHADDCLNAHPENNHRFHVLLVEHDVTAFFCGHTHGYSAALINGLWQIDAGHSRGLGDKGARSTFLRVRVAGDNVSVDVYRDDASGGPYQLTRTVVLDCGGASE